ncbi:nitrilase-related carbon-nitrogen hydrolase [Streptomyces sp. NPDC046821]|uniref:nitrilase-related carbon-nitrogen hydrolase n=1 Tax=Streptomyces sp. NPDC046821 TaxID=3154702 RepID=UPI0033FF0B93
MTNPYTAVGLIPEITEIQDRDDIAYAHTCAITLPGAETQELGRWAREFNIHVMAQARALHPAFPDRYFNVGFVIDPTGKIVLRHYKLTPLPPMEHSLSPHDVLTKWTHLYGSGPEAFWPVTDTAIGRLGTMMANEASYPENARGLALAGCEIAYRTSYPLPGVASDAFDIQNRSRALDNLMYVLAPNPASYTGADGQRVDFFGGHSTITDHTGRTIGHLDHGGVPTFVTATIDLPALRRQRTTAAWTNWPKDLRTELYRTLYDQPIYPANLYTDRPPYDHAEYRKHVTEPQIELMGSVSLPGSAAASPGSTRAPSRCPRAAPLPAPPAGSGTSAPPCPPTYAAAAAPRRPLRRPGSASPRRRAPHPRP